MDTRLIKSQPLSGVENMAVDETLLRTADQGGPATLRLYAWSEPTLSLGYFQTAGDRELDERLKPLPLVRRASGGGAIVHHHELTYSFANRTRESEEQYIAFHETLIEAFSHLGIEASTFERSGQRPPAAPPAFLCFRRRTAQDIVVGEHKVVGSAQRKRKAAMLQHGSILLKASPHAPQLAGLLDTSESRIPSPAAEKIAATWLPLLEKRLGIRLSPGRLGKDEKIAVRELERSKFGADGWNLKR